MHFASLLSGGFTATTVINQPEKKLAKRTSVRCIVDKDRPRSRVQVRPQVKNVMKVRLLGTKSVLTMLLPSDTGHFELCTLVESFRRFSCSLGPFGIHSKLGYM